MRSWSQEQVAYMHDALRFTDYYQQIASHIISQITPDDAVCDAGCGLGCLGMELLPYCACVTCVDRDAVAIADIRSRHLPRMTALCGDVEALPPAEPYNAMVFCLFGSTEQALRIAKAQCCGRIFLIKRNYDRHRFSAGNVPLGEYNAQSTAHELTEKGIPYQVQSFTAAFGQPFRSMEQARRFFEIYNRSQQEMTDDMIKERLVKGPTPEFPLFLPHTKSLQMFTLDTKEIP